jgi:hypothetical protein
MGSLYNLYISQSYQSLIHLGNDWTASSTLTALQDGYGNSLGVSVNTLGNITTIGDITASKMFAPIISASSLYVSGTIYAYEINTTIESSSIIFSSGSNILGDAMNDTQTLVGRVIATGSLEVTGSTKITGNTTITGSLVVNGLVTTPNLATTASNNFIGKEQITGSLEVSGGLSLNGSSSFTELTGSLAAFSSSISLRILNAAGILQLQSQSVTLGLAKTLNFGGADVSVSFSNETGSVFVRTTQFATTGSNTFVGSNTFTQWITGSISGSIYGISDTLGYSSSVNSRLNNTMTSASAYSASAAVIASAYSASAVAIFATTGSNLFVGNQTITGSLSLSSSAAIDLNVIGNSSFSGSVRGNVIPLSIASNTASLDCSLGNFYTLTLVASTATHISASNINPGETISLRVTQPSGGSGTTTFSSNIKFPLNFTYIATPLANQIDIISMVSYDTNSLYANAVNTLT